MADHNDADSYVFYRYKPSLAAATIFVVLFSLTTGLHAFQSFKKRSWFMTPFIIGGLFETIGYIGRILSSKDQYAQSPYIMQTLLLLLGPALYAASIYMILGRLILLTRGERYSLVRRTWLTKIFVGGDIISFFMQGAGGGVMASGASGMKSGEKIIIGGLCVQILFFGLFFITAILFQLRGKEHLATLDSSIPWKKHLFPLYVTSVLILIRSLFRVIEYIQGNDGYLLRHEVYLYVFDAVLMFAVMVILNVSYPGDIALLLKEQQKERPQEFELMNDDTAERGIVEKRSR
ncbi:RTA1 like protein-domain-containing protein [Boeremia exigua]|uniref:RTA1 like protein-domain-containing protein n=1 Tax=Boeremia exigua TaxID=749465 RepID=UPI001E8E65B2|nr:RTA1 like protein-domain-containing protein [Boeremia exigua]KAH6614960.1 RTA1 like protein-domain-containing protein [Boeremia exigua]